MSLDAKLLTPKHQPEIVDLFNRLVKLSRAQSGAAKLARILSTGSADNYYIDDKHELDENVRIELERKLKSVPDGTLDASTILTAGPFKGKSLLWIACYIGASDYTFYDEKDELVNGYSYILGLLIPKSHPSSLSFDSKFTLDNTSLSTLWLAMYAHLKTLSKDGMWIVGDILEILSTEQLLKLDFNTLSTKRNGVAMSALALVVESDIAVVNHKIKNRNFVAQLLKRIPPRLNPGFYNFNAPVLDKAALGMTTLCFAAKGDADFIQRNVISSQSPFLCILQEADLSTLNFKAKILVGNDKGKSPLWYASAMLDDDEEALDCIIENADIKQLDFNDKAEDPNDKQANKSALWFVSHHYSRKASSKQLELVFAKTNDLSKLDFNNAPTSSKDKQAGQSVLWNLGEAALNGKFKPFMRVVKLGQKTNLDYSARAQHGENSDKSVLGLALALAMKGNFKTLNSILRNIKVFGLKAEAIQGYELEMLCHLAKQNHLYPLETLLPYIKFTPDLLNRNDSTGNSNKNVLFMLIELAWFGYPHFLKAALKEMDISKLTLGRKKQNPDTQKAMKELRTMVTEVAKCGEQLDMPILDAFVKSGYETLAEQLNNLELPNLTQADIMDYKVICDPVITLTAHFNQLQLSSTQQQKNRTEATSHNTRTHIKINRNQ